MRRVVLHWVGLLALASGEVVAQEATPQRDPGAVFEHLWQAIDRSYAQFPNKGVDWDALYRVYRPRISAETTDEDLFSTVVAMIGHLNDSHVCLSDGDRRVCSGVSNTRPESVRESIQRMHRLDDLVTSRYLQGEATTALDGKIKYGWLSDRVAYLRVRDFKSDEGPTVEAIDSAMADLTSAEAMVLDLRYNTGGTGDLANKLANRFADRTRRFMTTRIRYGAQRDGFLPTVQLHVTPEGRTQFNGPTMVLTNRLTESAGERAVLGMRVLPHVTVVGDYTGGAFGSQYPQTLPNGWTLFVTYKLSLDHHGRSWDGIGLLPDVFVAERPEEIAAGTDQTLETALALVRAGGMAPRDDPSTLDGLRISVVEAARARARSEGFGAAIAFLDTVLATEDEAYFLDLQELTMLGQQLVGAERYPEAISLLDLSRREHPEFAMTYGILAAAYLNSGDEDAAREVIAAGDQVEATYAWEKSLFNRVKEALENGGS